MDYAPGPYSVTFSTAANDRQCINIPLVNDQVPDGDETFTVSLNLPTAGNPMVIPGNIPSALVNIIGKMCTYHSKTCSCVNRF